MPDWLSPIWHIAQQMEDGGTGGNGMSDTPESNQRNPLSSSSSNTSGTHALSIRVEKSSDENTATEADAPTSAKSENASKETFLHPVANNENQTSGPEAELAGEEQVDQFLAGDGTELGPAPQQETVPFATPAAEPLLEQAAETSRDSATGGSSRSANAIIEDETARDANEAAASVKITKELSDAARKTMNTKEVSSERAFVMLEQISYNFSTAMEDARNDAARISFKLMEFAQASFRNNFEFAREYSAARSVPDVFNVQAAYFKRQMDLMNKQTEELRRLTSEIASKKAAQIQGQIKNQ
jgi:hypothetical protein